MNSYADSAVVEIGGDADWIARYLAGSALEYEVVQPAAVRDELRLLGLRLLERNSSQNSEQNS